MNEADLRRPHPLDTALSLRPPGALGGCHGSGSSGGVGPWRGVAGPGRAGPGLWPGLSPGLSPGRPRAAPATRGALGTRHCPSLPPRAPAARVGSRAPSAPGRAGPSGSGGDRRRVRAQAAWELCELHPRHRRSSNLSGGTATARMSREAGGRPCVGRGGAGHGRAAQGLGTPLSPAPPEGPAGRSGLFGWCRTCNVFPLGSHGDGDAGAQPAELTAGAARWDRAGHGAVVPGRLGLSGGVTALRVEAGKLKSLSEWGVSRRRFCLSSPRARLMFWRCTAVKVPLLSGRGGEGTVKGDIVLRLPGAGAPLVLDYRHCA